jgi:hypothetical protein
MSKKISIFAGLFIGIVFFLIGLFTLSDYGLNVDESIHFIRGQAYLSFLTTGRKNYSDKDLNQARVSVWKYPQYDAAYFLKKDTGHPPFNDILAALFNRIFYEKLGIVGDMESYHLFELTISSLLVIFIYFIVKNNFGFFPAVISALSIFLYPLFFAESKFNIKDPIETAFFTFSLFYLYEAFTQTKVKKLILGIFFFGFGLATKFNILFLPFILLPTVLSHFWNKFKLKPEKIFRQYSLLFYLFIIGAPIIIITIYIIFRPYVWVDPITRIIETFKYYKDIGTGDFIDVRFLFRGWNFYAPFFVLITTPFQISILAILGLFFSIKNYFRNYSPFYLLVIFWLITPMIRVMIPGTTIYSGVRQIMEFLPAMAILCGIGAYHLVKTIRTKFGSIKPIYFYVTILILCFPLVITLKKIHPNQNVYMNFLIGGLKGAYEKRIPGTGETMGNVYLQGVKWLNSNVSYGSKLGIAVGLRSNIPFKYLRNDIDYGPYISGMDRLGEYMIEKVSVGFPPNENFYVFNYLNKFLNPIYEVKVDGVSLLKIWKNEEKYIKAGYLNEGIINNLKITKNNPNEITLSLPDVKTVTRLIVNHSNLMCIPKGKEKENIEYSIDGNVWVDTGNLFIPQGPRVTLLQTPNRYVQFFAAEEIKYLKIKSSNSKSCLLKPQNTKVYYLKDVRI